MIIFLYGSDNFRSKRLADEMKAKFIKDVKTRQDSLESLDGEEISFTDISEKINTGSLFSSKRLIIINNIFKNKKKSLHQDLAKYLPKLEKPEDIILIFRDSISGVNKKLSKESKDLFSILKKQKYSQEFKELNPSQKTSFIIKEVNKYNKKITKEAASEILKRSNGDLWIISQGIKKAAMGSEKEVLKTDDIIPHTKEKYNEDIFSLTDAMGAKNKKQAIKILEEQYEAGLSDEYLIAMLERHFKILLQIKSGQEDGLNADVISKTLKLHPYVVKKGLNQAKNFNKLEIKEYLNAIIQIDKDVKSGKSKAKNQLSLLIFEM